MKVDDTLVEFFLAVALILKSVGEAIVKVDDTLVEFFLAVAFVLKSVG